jgi:hypothetical protein
MASKDLSQGGSAEVVMVEDYKPTHSGVCPSARAAESDAESDT